MATQTVLLGSGDLYILDSAAVPDPVNATEEEIDNNLIKIGEISSGATLTYSTEFKTVKGGALNQEIARFLTSEQISFKTGIVTWDMKNISKLIAAHYSEDQTAETRRLGIGGLGNVPINYLRFQHLKKTDGKYIKINMFKAQNQNGIEIPFNSENETVIDVEFKLLADTARTNGNIVEIIEEL
jgi:hypothetical protein